MDAPHSSPAPYLFSLFSPPPPYKSITSSSSWVSSLQESTLKIISVHPTSLSRMQEPGRLSSSSLLVSMRRSYYVKCRSYLSLLSAHSYVWSMTDSSSVTIDSCHGWHYSTYCPSWTGPTSVTPTFSVYRGTSVYPLRSTRPVWLSFSLSTSSLRCPPTWS